MSDRLYRRGKIWCGWVYEGEGPSRRQVRKSTGCTDKKAALAVLATWERRAVDPDGAAKAEATLGEAFDVLFEATHARATSKKPTRSMDTEDFQRKQSNSWLLFAGMKLSQSVGPPKGASKQRRADLRNLGGTFPLAWVKGGFVDEFMNWRRMHGVSEGTIGKDLSVLRPACRAMLRAGRWGGSLEQTFPRHEIQYEPGDRWLSYDELKLLLSKLEPGRAAVIAFAYAVGAEPRAIARALRSDLADETATMVHVRGTKRRTRDRWVPVRTSWQLELLNFARAHADGSPASGKLFSKWSNQRRVLAAACTEAEITQASLTAMRHSFAHMMKGEGVAQEDLAVAMGHRDTKMLDSVYARASTPAELSQRFAASMAVHSAAHLMLLQGGKGAEGADPPATGQAG